jgi:glycosyltransferase involved in cell wall biosynthesis
LDGRVPRIAIVSDPLVQRGGAERVVETIARAYPNAPIFTTLYSAQTGPASLEGRITSSWLQRIPGAARHHRWLLPFYAGAIESLDLGAFDIIISSHHSFAKGILRKADQLHICYCHTPMRALWERTHEEIRSLPGIIRWPARAMLSRLRMWDYAGAARVDHFIANSTTTARRIAKHYGRESTILWPPIDVNVFTPGGEAGDYYLVVSRMVPYKRTDIAIEATGRMGRRLIITGGRPRGRASFPSHVEFAGVVDDGELVRLMRGARALLSPQFEDFGMAVLEMNACGRPVIAYGAGRALDTVIDGKTGLLVREQTVEGFEAAIRRFESLKFDSDVLRAHAETFASAAFVRGLREFIDEARGAHPRFSETGHFEADCLFQVTRS